MRTHVALAIVVPIVWALSIAGIDPHMDNDPVALIGLSVIRIILSIAWGVIVGSLIARAVIAWKDRGYEPDPKLVPLFMNHLVKQEEFKLFGVWCTSCGSRMIEWKRQHGFEAKTGLPCITKTLACPDWNGEDESRRAWTLPGSFFTRQVHPCENVVMGPATPATEHDHDEREASLECVRCLIDMEKMGVLDRDAVSYRIAAIMEPKAE